MMRDFNPLISVIIPCYNQGIYLSEALQSIVNQTYTNWECIIVNDGSTDETEKIAGEWTNKDSRIKHYSKKNGGLSSARNFGLNYAGGEYIQFLDADDTLKELKLEITVGQLEILENKKTIIISDFEMYDQQFQKFREPFCELGRVEFSFKTLLSGWDIEYTVPIHCAVFPSYFFSELRFEESLGAKEDWVMWLSVFKKYHPDVVFLKKRLAIYRLSSGSMSGQKKLMYENTARAFEFIYNKIIDNNEISILLKKMNDYWLKEILLYEKENYLIRNSYYFKFRDAFMGFLKRTGLRKVKR